MQGSDRDGGFDDERTLVTERSADERTVAGAGDGGGATFRPGDQVAERYRVVRFIAAGGMGEVYAVDDLELNERVALKTVKPGVVDTPQVTSRFRREIQMARKVTHPNVCRIFELGNHGGQVFCTMELLEGQTLAERLAERGPLGEDEALPLVRQMLAALQAAHEAGVIHRDFKSSNVILLGPRPGGRDGSSASTLGERAVVTDFGLARPAAVGDGHHLTLTTDGLLLGTPAYMAPEQVEGDEVGPTADLYAFGVVLYEMVTGCRPFDGPSPIKTALMRLREEPQPPSVHRPDLDRRWEAVILRCLEREPGRRFQSADEVLAALVSGPVPGRAARWLRRRRPRFPAVIAVAAVATAAAVGGWLLSARPWAWPETATVTSQGIRRAVAVVGFKNLAGAAESDWLGLALTEMMATELASGGVLRILPGESVARMKADLALGDADSFDPATLARIRRHLGADLVVTGAFLVMGEDPAAGEMRLDLRVLDTASGDSLEATSERGRQAELFDLVAAAGDRLRQRLGAGAVSAAEALAVRATLPGSGDAARAYVEGLGALRRFDRLAAREELERAVALDPGHAFSHWALARTLWELGHDEQARVEARLAHSLATSLGREERLRIEAFALSVERGGERALEIYRSLVTVFPDNLDYGLELAQLQREERQSEAAEATLAALRQLPPPLGDDPRIDLQAAWTAYTLAQYPRAAELAERAIAAADQRGARLQAAEGWRALGWAANRLGELERAAAAFERSRALFEAAGDRLAAALAMQGLGGIRSAQGRLDEAHEILAGYLATSRDIGCSSCLPGALVALAQVRQRQGELDAARALFAEAQGRRQEAGDELGAARTELSLLALERQQGRLAGLPERVTPLLELFRARGDRQSEGRAAVLLAEAAWSGGDLEGARGHFEAARALWRATSQRLLEARTGVELAALLADRGELVAAAELGRASLSELEAKGSDADRAFGHAVAAWIAAAQGRRDEAATATASAAAQAAGSSDAELHFWLVWCEARTALALGGEAVAGLGARLQEAVTAARAQGRTGDELELRLLAAELAARRAGGAAEASGQLAAVAQEAAALGYRRVAERAAARARDER